MARAAYSYWFRVRSDRTDKQTKHKDTDGRFHFSVTIPVHVALTQAEIDARPNQFGGIGAAHLYVDDRLRAAGIEPLIGANNNARVINLDRTVEG